MVVDGGGHFSPAAIDGVHTLSLLLLSHTAHDRRAEGNPHTHTNNNTNVERETWVQYKPRQGYELRTPVSNAWILMSTPT